MKNADEADNPQSAHTHFKKMSFETFLVVIVSVLLHSRIFRGNFVGLLQGTESYVP